MNQILSFAEATHLANHEREPREPFFLDYCVRVVGTEDDQRFELWKRRRGEGTERLGVFDTFGAAQTAADHDLGRKIVEESWREGDGTDWALPAP